jgi:hypothetical protein
MYDRIRRTAGLAHIDALTHCPVRSFFDFPRSSDVFIIGGNGHSSSTLISTLTALRWGGYDVTFSHVLCDESNSFAIDCLTGETWLNDEVHLSTLNVDINKSFRVRMFDFRALAPITGPLSIVDVPIK